MARRDALEKTLDEVLPTAPYADTIYRLRTFRGIDTLTGGDDVDRFRDTAAGLNGDRITDFLPGDRIQIMDLGENTGVVRVVFHRCLHRT